MLLPDFVFPCGKFELLIPPPLLPAPHSAAPLSEPQTSIKHIFQVCLVI